MAASKQLDGAGIVLDRQIAGLDQLFETTDPVTTMVLHKVECCVGTLSILDTKPRHLDDSALRLLGDLAQFVVREMDPKVGLGATELLIQRRG